jgi:hypothetical protein
MKETAGLNSDHIEVGEAIDQEKIIALRSQIEDYVRENFFEFSSTKLFWNMNPKGTFDYELHFFK